ncbi:1464_t:CDS:2 [Acaulospora morrowiae]|uniref:1464_t:CDS:1 n=1 Tax=Acaulospora morrowiae TaxID=94023 RepID=A0A9N9A1V8_9GLOM|nr:1464_t:CDS:2 [Acaulospora morrowiae]
MSHTEESLLEFSMKFLDAVFGEGDTPEVTLTRFEVNDPNEQKIQPADEDHALNPQDLVQTKHLDITQPLPPQNEQTSVESKKASSELIDSGQATNSSHVSAAQASNKMEEKSDSVTQLNSESKEKTVSTAQLNNDSKENTLEKRSSGLIDATLKRRSIIGLEMIESLDILNNEPITEELHIETHNPSHLFWVPAHLHPEIAPNEFRKWLKNHVKDEYSSGMSSLRRRKSMLSRQYIPTENDEDEQSEKDVDANKKVLGFDWDSYAASDENINLSAESSKLNVIRRSLSLNFSPFAGFNSNPKDPNVFDRHSSSDVDSPVLIPRMAPALKRTARTKIRRNSVAGEQNPRRFSAHRRTKSTHVLSGKKKNGSSLSIRAKKTSDPNLSITLLSSQSDEYENIENEMISSPNGTEKLDNDIELDFIESNNISGPIRITLKDNGPAPRRTSSLPPGAHDMSDSLQEGRVPLPDKTKLYVNIPGASKNTTEVSTSPSTSPLTSPLPSPSTSPSTSQTPSDAINTPQQKRSSTWTSWFFGANSDEKDKESKTKKQKAEKVDHENTESVNKGSKMSLSSIFSWSSQNKGKPSDDNIVATDSAMSDPNPVSPTVTPNKKPKYTNYNRLPIHVERSIYRLSHYKLANNRRPLHEQVLISNMMFWYLSLINKQQIESGGEVNPNAEKEVIKVKSKVGKSNGGRKRRKGEKKGTSSGARRRGGPSAEIAYKAPRYDMQQVSQYITQGNSLYSPEYDDEFETYSDSEDSSEYSEEEIYGRKYHYYDDGYVSDGTDGGHLNDNQDFNGDSIGSNYNTITDEFDRESDSITSTRSPSPNGRSPLKSLKNRLSNSSNARHSANKQTTSPARPQLSSPGSRHHHLMPRVSNIKNNLQEDDEDDDVPLGLYKTGRPTK